LYTYMASKTITITEDAYVQLVAHKRGDESLSDVIRRLTSAKTDPIDSAGTYPGLGVAVEEARAELEAELEDT